MDISDQEKSLSRVLRAIEAIRSKGMVIMVDEEDRENEGDIVFAADHVTPDKVNFMVKEARGLICLAMDPFYIERLQLPLMKDERKQGCARETAFTVSIEAKRGITTGISAFDRAETIRVAVDPNSNPDDIVVPGHIFPLKARAGGVIERAGHTEGSVDLAKMAGCGGAAVICEIMKDDGSMARMPDLEVLAQKYELPIVTIPDLINYRLMQDSLVELERETRLETSLGEFDAKVFRSKVDGHEHIAFVKGGDLSNNVVDVRVHIQRPIVDVFSDSEVGGRRRILHGLEMLRSAEHGVLIYLSSSSSTGISDDINEMELFQSSDRALQPSPHIMDKRQIGVGSQILRNLGVRRMRVHASSAKPYVGLSGFGLEVVETVIITTDKG